MTYAPKKGDIVVIRERGAIYMELPLYIVTGNTQTRYECMSPSGATVYKLATEMNPRGREAQHVYVSPSIKHWCKVRRTAKGTHNPRVCV